MKTMLKRRGLPVLLIALLVFSSCQKEEELTDGQKAADALYGLMQDWYLWYDQLPVVGSGMYGSPGELLEAVRYQPVDRWSYVSTWQEFMQYYSAGEYVGFGFGNFLYNGKIYISFLFEDSPFYADGVTRGWYIDRINGNSVSSYQDLFNAIGPDEEGVQRQFDLVGPQGQTLSKTYTKKVIEMNTVLHADTLHVAGKVVGHLVLKSFIGPTRAELDSVFQVFSSRGVEELILDLRYNGGGQMDVCVYLASQISGPATDGQVFVTQQYNDKKTEETFSVPFAATGLVPLNQLGLSRLIVLASAGTASASEAIINGLDPYMEVITIGDDTYGKPAGMNVWNYLDEFAFVPVTFKLTNKEGFGEYYDGLPADSYVTDDPSRDFGDREETTLKEAIYYLETGTFTAGAFKKSMSGRLPELKGLKFEIGAF